MLLYFCRGTHYSASDRTELRLICNRCEFHRATVHASTPCNLGSIKLVGVSSLLASRFITLKKSSHFDLKIWVTGGTKIRLGIPSVWRIFKSNWLDIWSQIDSILRVKLTIRLSTSSQFDSNILQLIGISGRDFVPPVTQIFRSKWLHFFFLWGSFNPCPQK